MPEGFICKQCGSTSFEDINTNRIKCSHCGSMSNKYSGDPAVVIGKCANIIIGKTANVEIQGDLEIQEGANVDIQGQVVINDRKKTMIKK
ncbi:MAG: hypothetical protein E4H33_01120 [Anaerolineales bacterium]|nr:MAG: hypothetical protein E4H33_01120 [Anaerolineales bacterium]